MAVDPQRLERQLNELTKLVGDPERLLRAIRELLDSYQVRRRSSGRLRASVPRPVLRALSRSLRAGLHGSPEATAEVATELWSADRPETRQLAAHLLAVEHGERAAQLAERWTHGSVAVEHIRELTEVGLAGWRSNQPEQFLQRCELWLQDRYRLLGLYALRSAVADPRFEHLPQVYRLIEGLGGSLRGRPRRAMLELMQALARREPMETVQFLRGELANSGGSAERLVRDLLPSLQDEQRQALRSANGIIRARAGHRSSGELER